jgi:ketosteroid isomerase-like protein
MGSMSTIDDPMKQLEKLNRAWMESYVKRDTAFLKRYLSDSYVGTFPDGTVLDKSGEIAALTSGSVVLDEMTAREMKVQVYGEAAVITGRSAIRAKVNGRDESGEYRFTDVWVKQADRWLAVASQVTPIAKQ